MAPTVSTLLAPPLESYWKQIRLPPRNPVTFFSIRVMGVHPWLEAFDSLSLQSTYA
jgi:hypothetical protein